MDHQATLDGRQPPKLARDAAEVARDVAALADLQARLLADDLRNIRKGLTTGLVLQLGAMSLIVAALPVAVAGVGLLLAEIDGVSLAGGLLLAALLAAVAAIALALGGWRLLKQQGRGLARSREELAQNVRLLKSVLARNRATDFDRWES